MKRNLFNGLVIMLLLVAALPVASMHTAQAADTVTIGLSLPTTQDPFYAGVLNGAEATADELGLELVVVTADNDPAAELANVEALLAAEVDVLLISPVDAAASSAAIELANTAEVPVVLVSGPAAISMDDVAVAVTVSLDNTQGGAVAGNLVCEMIADQGAVVEIVGDLDTAVMAERSAGFSDYMTEHCADVALVQFAAAGMDRDTFIDAFTALLAEHDVASVAVLNEAMTLPAVEAAIIARQNNISFVSFDSSDDALTALDQGHLNAIVLPYGWWLGEAGVQASSNLAAGDMVDAAILVELGVMDLTTAVRGPGFGNNGDFGSDPRAGKGAHGGDGELEGGDGELEGGDGELEGGDGELEGGDGELEGGDGELEGGDGELEGGDGELEGGDGELEGGDGELEGGDGELE